MTLASGAHPPSYMDGAPAESPGDRPAIRLQNVVKQFDGPIIIDDLTLDVRPGEFVSLVGASGCGKSTLLNIISGLDKQTSGVVETSGRPSFMFQEAALMPWLTAGRNVELALTFSGVPRSQRKAKAQDLLSLVHLERAYDQRPHELSGGMRQRVAIARSLALGREILLMDEPFGALDTHTKLDMHSVLLSLWERERQTVLFVTHNVREAVRLSQRVLLMSSRPGRIIKEWNIGGHEPWRLDSPDVSSLASEITDDLRKEILRHAN